MPPVIKGLEGRRRSAEDPKEMKKKRRRRRDPIYVTNGITVTKSV